MGLGRLQGGGGIFSVLSRLDVSEDGEEIAEEGAMWANAGESGFLFGVFGEPEYGLLGSQSMGCVLGRVRPGIRSDYSRATADQLRGCHPYCNHRLECLS